jgi:hypothetical protein
MRRNLTMALVALTMVCALQAGSQSGVSLGSAQWLAGSWRMKREGTVIEEQWTTPRGGMMLGVSRTVKLSPEKTVAFEFFRIEQRGNSLVYIAQPGGHPPTEFKLESASENQLLFANPQHDFPKRIRYTRNSDGSLTARIEDETGKNAVEFPYRAAK